MIVYLRRALALHTPKTGNIGTTKVYITIINFIQALVSLLKYNPSSSKISI